MQPIVGQTFHDQEVVIDDKCYISCKFVNCKIIYAGGDHSLVNVNWENCQIVITGDAQKTIQFMLAMGMLPPAPVAMAQIPESPALH